MPKRSDISYLPEPILSQLHDRLVDEHFSDYIDIAAWLQKLGHATSKSALHRDAMRNERLIREDVAGRRCEDVTPEIRMRCLEVASRLPGLDLLSIMEKTDRLLEWVKNDRIVDCNPCN
jgi:hypothetical protein